MGQTDVIGRMSLLASFVCRLKTEEIWAFLDSLFPNMTEDEKENLYAQIVLPRESQKGDAHSADDVFGEIENDRGMCP